MRGQTGDELDAAGIPVAAGQHEMIEKRPPQVHEEDPRVSLHGPGGRARGGDDAEQVRAEDRPFPAVIRGIAAAGDGGDACHAERETAVGQGRQTRVPGGLFGQRSVYGGPTRAFAVGYQSIALPIGDSVGVRCAEWRCDRHDHSPGRQAQRRRRARGRVLAPPSTGWFAAGGRPSRRGRGPRRQTASRWRARRSGSARNGECPVSMLQTVSQGRLLSIIRCISGVIARSRVQLT